MHHKPSQRYCEKAFFIDWLHCVDCRIEKSGRSNLVRKQYNFDQTVHHHTILVIGRLATFKLSSVSSLSLSNPPFSKVLLLVMISLSSLILCSSSSKLLLSLIYHHRCNHNQEFQFQVWRCKASVQRLQIFVDHYLVNK